MLHFFRKYQRYFFWVVTVAIVVSFSFFGTYNAFTGSNYHEQVAFVAIDGTPVTRHELEALAVFLGTDADDKLIFNGAWGPNFLNDGVVRKDFLQTGLAALIAKQYAPDLLPDLQPRLDKEKRYVLYTHPQAPQYVSTEAVWAMTLPEIKTHFDALRSNSNPISPEAFESRVNLYLAEHKIPAPVLQYYLMNKQKQYSWITSDPAMERQDFSLFGYHTLDDWFGPRFMRLVSETIINSAIIAQKQGYEVTKEEALADLIRNADKSYRQNQKSSSLGVANSNEYFREQLQRMNLDQTKAAQIWTQVLLFRRLFHEMGESVFVDPMTFEKYQAYAKESIEGSLYRLPQVLRFGNMQDLREYEAYVKAVSAKSDTENPLAMPKEFKDGEAVAATNPELVQKNYLLEYAHLNTKTVQGKMSLKEMWDWELADANWEKLKKQFPELGVKKGGTQDERYAALNDLDPKTRSKLDTYAREQIVEAHPHWMEEALQDAVLKTTEVAIPLKGNIALFPGVKDNAKLIALLDKAEISAQDPALAMFTEDNVNYYRIIVLDKSMKPEVMSFAEAKKAGVLTDLAKKTIDDSYMERLQQAIRSDYATAIAPTAAPKEMLPEVVASLRFYNYTRSIREKINKEPLTADQYAAKLPVRVEGKVAHQRPLGDQYLFDVSLYHSDRAGEGSGMDLSEAFKLKQDEWSKVYTPVNGDVYFFQLKNRGYQVSSDALSTTVSVARTKLGNEAQRALMSHLLKEFKDKQAISLDFMNQGTEMTPVPEA